jgi:glycosyltransferase involved in cell wall biosynthesis
MACETPVITSNTSAMPEVAGDAAIYADPFDVDSIESAISEVITNYELQKSLKERGLNRTKEFSWIKSSEKLLKIYNDVVNNGRSERFI